MRARYSVIGAVLAFVLLTSCEVWGYDAQADSKTRQMLTDTVITFNFQDLPVDQVVEYLSTLGAVNIVLDRPKVMPGQTVTLRLSNVSLETGIRFVTEAIGLRYVIRDGVVIISDEEGTRQQPVTRVYDVLDIIAEVPEFEGPNMDLGSLSSSSSGSGTGGQQIWNPGVGVGTGTGANANQTKSLQERTEELVELIKEVIAPGTWDATGY